ncbi:MAG: restriction endonuclease subunit S [Chloroflexi bacterium]|nr:restriction endonuclease subunit S [Chloroflexota bacterium]
MVTDRNGNGGNLGELPRGWALATIPDLVDRDGIFVDGDWVESKDQDLNGDVRLIQLADVGDGVYRDRSNRFLTRVKARDLGCTFLKPGDVLVARMPDPLGRACIFPGDSKPSVTVVDVCIVRAGSNGANHRWLVCAINAPDFRGAIAALQSGSTRKRISRSNLAKLQLPVPPLAEQHRIFAKIEELFSDLDAGVAALQKVKAQLKRYRQAVLKAAVEGKLTADWRAANTGRIEPASVLLERIRDERAKNANGKAKPLPPVDVADFPTLPEESCWTRVGNVSRVLGGKRLPKGHGYSETPTKHPYIRVTDCENMTVQTDRIEYLRPETQAYISRYTISKDDLYISIAGTIGKVGLIAEKLDGANLTENAAKITGILGYDKRYLCFVLNSNFCQEQIVRLTISSNQPKLALFRIEQIVIPLPPLDEQQQIVAEVERRLSVADAIEKTVDQSLMQAERLRQSILKRAFAGRLVPQDPNDEPAEKLLERTRAAREKGHAQGVPQREPQRKRAWQT